MSFRFFTFSIWMSALLFMTSCSHHWEEVARNVALPAQMLHRTVNAPPFELTIYDRIRQKGGDATFYIEGDGLAWLSRTRPSLNPTPRTPIGLHLAARDKSKNVIYMARPCQYSGMMTEQACPMEYWTGRRFAPEVVTSMNNAISHMKQKFDLRNIHLVGYSGGGGLAVLIAARRDDVASIRTVAGNINHEVFTDIHGISPMHGSLNPVDAVARVAHIPQMHFLGEWDEVVTPGIYLSFRQAMMAQTGDVSCLHSSTVKRADHSGGWDNKWPELLKMPVRCTR